MLPLLSLPTLAAVIGRINGFLGVDLYVLLSPAVIFAFCITETATTEISFTDKKLIISKGLVFYRIFETERAKILELSVKTTAAGRIFGASTVTVSPDGKRKITVIMKTADAKRLFSKNHTATEKFGIKNSLITALSAALSGYGILLYATALHRAMKFMSAAVSTIGEKYQKLLSYLPYAADVLLISVSAFIFAVFLITLDKNLAFESKTTKNSRIICRGLIIRTVTEVPNEAVKFCKMPLLMRCFSSVDECLAVGNGIPQRPAVRKTSKKIHLSSAGKRFAVYCFNICILLSVAFLIIPQSDYLGKAVTYTVFAAACVLLIIKGAAGYCFASENKVDLCGDKLICDGYLSTVFISAKINRTSIAAVRFLKNPFDKKYGTCKVTVSVKRGTPSKFNAHYVNQTRARIIYRFLRNISGEE